MFTGIVQETGKLATRDTDGGDLRLGIEVSAGMAERIRPGGSLALNGVCLTVTQHDGSRLTFDVSAETLSRTRLGELETGARLNLEPPLSASDPVGGHFVTGHVDGVGEVKRVESEGGSHRVEVQAPEALLRYIAVKGSIAVDGVSLTVNEVNGTRFGFNVIPHTWSVTNMQGYAAGTPVHLEVDLIARYLERLVGERDAAPAEHDITTDFLSRQGFAPPLLAEDDEDAAESDGGPPGDPGLISDDD